MQAASPPVLTERDQEKVNQHFRAGMEALGTEKWDRAETEFKAAAKIDPLFDAAFYGLGQVYMARREYDDAIRAYVDSRHAFLEGARLRATNKTAMDRRIRDQIQTLQDYIRDLERAGTRRNPNLVADIQRHRTRIRQLQAQLTLSAASMPEVPAGLSMALGSAFFRTGNLVEAEREYLEAVRVDADFGEAHNNLAVVYLVTGRLDKAEREIVLAEKTGFKVSEALKADLKKRKGGVSAPEAPVA
jgi:Flp pilus assembly protein TadD